MSVVIEQPKSPRSRKGAKWEKWGWMYMRISGVILLGLIFWHLISNLVMGDGISGIDFAFVAGKWANPWIQLMDGAMLWLALIHGTNGMRTIVNDYAERVAVRKTLTYVLWATCAALIVLGTLVIFTFDPCPANGTIENLPSFCPAVK